jgi:DUF1365 family protein
MRSHLLEGTVEHRRAGPVTYALRHRVWYLAVDLDELEAVARRIRLLRRNARGLVEIRDADHWLPPATDLRASVIDHLRRDGVDPEGWRITLVSYPRVLGHVFNPASFFLCRDAAGDLRTVVVEVHNTHHERHLYTLHGGSGDRLGASMEKAFYVSPFLAMQGTYTVTVDERSDSLRIGINERHDGAPLLATSLVLAKVPLSDRSLLRLLVRRPLVTYWTVIAIHLHAFRLWRRGLRFHRHADAAAAHRVPLAVQVGQPARAGRAGAAGLGPAQAGGAAAAGHSPAHRVAR